jgi:hypothetical protein
MVSLVIHAALGIATTSLVVWCNRRMFTGRWDGVRVTPLEGFLYLVAIVSVVLGWYFNIRYVQQYGKTASWVHFTQHLFTNWAADSAAQDYIIANVILFPIWTITDGRRRGISVPWGFFVMSLFTSFAFAMAAYLAVVERSVRYSRAVEVPTRADAPPRTASAASSTA